MRKKILVSLFVVVFSIFVLTFNAGAASVVYSASGTADSSSIELSSSTLNKAKSNCLKKTTSFSYSATINSKYQVHIYHFEAPSSAYYAFYTTGSSDTIIKVYEHQNFLWWTTSYKDLGKVDDTSKADSNRYNAGFVLNATKGEDYYICVRIFGTNTGSYKLNVELNEDKLLRTRYNMSYWDCEKLSYSSSMAGCWYTSKQYLSPEETILFYWSLDPACQKLVGIDLNYLYNAYSEGTQAGIDAANFIIGTLLSIANVNPAISVTASGLGAIISYAYNSTNNSAYSMMQTLTNECGVIYNGNSWTSSHGLVIKDFFTGTILGNKYYFEAYDNDILVGAQGEKGSWSN